MSQHFTYIRKPQARLISQAVQIIQNGGVIVYPTDSGYALGCQMGDKGALERICRIRRIDPNHDFTLVCRDLRDLHLCQGGQHGVSPDQEQHPGPYTFIFKATKEVPRRLMNEKKKTIGIRVPDNKIAQALLEALGEPLLSTTLILPESDMAEFDPEEIFDKLGKQLDLVVNGGYLGEQPTTVVDFSDDEPVLRRRGAGDPTPFE
ncbi:threonylcarbamoyl-AMP synthase [Aeromonas hydrophila]|uniref:Threonylcarbamoyl-AMP synthase n=1 Tax=Aeromonas hydrophila TaxID=644 RepID=A0A926IY73_AERHY|nr:threonylcarbamoyl-AMP synthase [Aeromonas hydrophila]